MGNPLLWRKRQFGERARGSFVRILEEEARMRLGQLSLGDIFATGLPKEEADRYYYYYSIA